MAGATISCQECGRSFEVEHWYVGRLTRCPECRASHWARSAVCVVCGQEWSCPPASSHRRCPACIAAGRGRCLACGMETKVRPGGQGLVLCQQCRAGETLEVKAPYVRLTCRGVTAFGSTEHARRCEWAKIVTLDRARARLRTLDERNATYICDHCHGLAIRAQGVPKRRRQAKDLFGTTPVVVSGPQASELIYLQARTSRRWRTKPPGPTNAHGHRVVSQDAVWQRVAGFWRRPGGARVIVGTCRWCGRLTFNAAADQERRVGPLRTHAACWRVWSRTPEARTWWRERRRLRRDRGLTQQEVDRLVGDHPALPPERRPTGRQYASEDLTRYFGWTVRYLLGKETQAALASEGSSRASVSEGISTILRLLPEPDRVGRRFSGYIRALRRADSRRRHLPVSQREAGPLPVRAHGPELRQR